MAQRVMYGVVLLSAQSAIADIPTGCHQQPLQSMRVSYKHSRTNPNNFASLLWGKKELYQVFGDHKKALQAPQYYSLDINICS